MSCEAKTSEFSFGVVRLWAIAALPSTSVYATVQEKKVSYCSYKAMPPHLNATLAELFVFMGNVSFALHLSHCPFLTFG